MTTKAPKSDLKVKRILVALDASPHSEEALEAAVELAHSLEAELEGIFIEDEDLLRLAGLPFVRELRHFSARYEDVSSQRIERELRTQARRAEAALARSAKPRRLHYSFRVLRGRVEAELLEAAEEADIVTVGRARSAPERTRKLGSVARAVVREASRTVMVLHRQAHPSQPVCVIYGACGTARKALAAGAQLAAAQGSELRVFIPDGDREQAAASENEVEEWLAGQRFAATVQRVAGRDCRDLLRSLQHYSCGAVIVERDDPMLGEDELHDFLVGLDCPVLLIR